MSLRVMQLKYYEKIRNNEINSKQIFTLNATNVGSTKSKCRSDVVRASKQKCYGVYNRQVLSGNNGLAAKVIDISSTYLPTITNVYKRPPIFQPNQYIDNKKSKAIRCQYYDDDGNAVNRPDPLKRDTLKIRKSHITQDLGFLSSKDYMEKIKSVRSCTLNGITDYESKLMRNPHGNCV